jgi:hypothetical protein
MNDDDLTPVEREALEALPREQTPSPFLEERVVRALRERGLLRPRRRRTVELTVLRVAVAVAAGIVLLLGGFVVGRWTGARPSGPVDTRPIEASQLALAASLQRAGTAYLAALEDLASSDNAPRSEEMRQGREVALTTLYTAAGEVSRIVPKSHMARQLLQALDLAVQRDPAKQDEGKAERLIWF